MNDLFLKPLTFAVSGMDAQFLRMSLLRYSERAYNASFSAWGLISATLKLPGMIFFVLWKARWSMRVYPKVDVLINGSDQSYWKGRFESIVEKLGALRWAAMGRSQEMERLFIVNEFFIGDALRMVAVWTFFWPYLLALSLRARRNTLAAYARTCIVYCRTLFYFKNNPCRLYFTYEDNACSPAFYSAFKNAGGETLCAFQNGIRFDDEGFSYSVFDHLFALGLAHVDFYKRVGSRIKNYTPIGSLLLGCQAHRILGGGDPRHDVTFVDQGIADLHPDYWPMVGTKHAKTFFDYVRRFAQGHPNLRLVYQMRSYEGGGRNEESYLRQWFSGSAMEIINPSSYLESHATVAASSVIVTMYSTLGLEALAMGKPTLFFNFTGKPNCNVLTGPLQGYACGYQEFEEKILSALKGEIGLKDINADYYISKNTFQAPHLVAEAIKRELGAS